MTLTVTTSNNSHEFDGPYESATDLQQKSGVYLISTKQSNGKHKVLDVGESGNVQHRVSNHDRADEWQQHKQDGIYMSARYCDESARMTLESELRTYFNPPCGDK